MWPFGPEPPKVSAYIKVVYEPEGEILTIDKKVTKHHQA